MKEETATQRELRLLKQRLYYAKNRERILASAKKHREDNREKCREKARKYKEENLELCRERCRDYYHRNKDKYRDYRQANIEKHREYNTEYRERHRERVLEMKRRSQKEYASKHPEKIKAHKMVNYLLGNGKIVKPDACCVCKKEGRVESHHIDYTKPLEILWVCRSCHYLLDEQRKKQEEKNKNKDSYDSTESSPEGRQSLCSSRC